MSFRTGLCFVIVCSYSSLLAVAEQKEQKIQWKISPFFDKINKINPVVDKLKTKLSKEIVLETVYGSIELRLSSNYVRQGSFVQMDIVTKHPVLKCFGMINGKKNYFHSIHSDYHFRSYVGFDIKTVLGLHRLRVAILFHDGSIQVMSNEIMVQKNQIVQPIPVYYYKKHRVRRIYRKGGEKKQKWISIRRRYIKWVKPPIRRRKLNHLNTYIHFQDEIMDKVIMHSKRIRVAEQSSSDITKLEPIHLGERIYINRFSERSYFLSALKTYTPIKYWQGNFIQPLTPKKGSRISPFGTYRVFYYRGRIRKGYHRGIDIPRSYGTPVYAANNGLIAISKRFKGTGNAIVINHGLGVYSSYFHLSRMVVKKDSFVRKGQLIGYVGSSGLSTGPHLHFEIRLNGISIDTHDWNNHFIQQKY